jgi:3-deoxy-manno-octulosonate cytidylyltransferase (CMP-KDO synthetase)
MKILGIIPARFASTRFPGKPLALIGDKSMIERVYLQACKSNYLNKVVIATDDERIAMHAKSFGAEVVMTSDQHPSGTDRCAEVILNSASEWDAVINIQGDEPFIKPEQIDLLAACFLNKEVQIATLIKEISSHAELINTNSPKVVINEKGDALYFSRQPIPFLKGVEMSEWIANHLYYKHIGIYGYRTDVLLELTKLQQGKLEKAESLEQLRWLENGYTIRTRITPFETLAIDTPEDLNKAQTLLA